MKRISIQRMLAATAVLLALAGCKDEYDNTKPSVKEPAVLAIQNASTQAEVVSLLEPKNRTIDLRVVANSISDENVTATFKVDRTLVDAYNKAHGTSYELCPAEAYDFSKKEVLLPRYNEVSSTAQVTLLSEKMPVAVDETGEPLQPQPQYLLPITIDEVKGDSRASVDEANNVYYILFSKRVLPSAQLLDRTDWKLLHTPSYKTNYGPEKVFDGNVSTFGFCNSDEDKNPDGSKALPPYYFVIDLGKPVMVRGLQLTARTETYQGNLVPRYNVATGAIATAMEITGNGMENEADWTYNEEWGTDVTTNELVSNPYLETPQWARYIRFRIDVSYQRMTYGAKPTFKGWAIAELNVWGNLEKFELD